MIIGPLSVKKYVWPLSEKYTHTYFNIYDNVIVTSATEVMFFKCLSLCVCL